jgi:ABC-type transport system involved in cytochrome bd biosynthesis fused ATPase/permease subunit
MKFTLKYNDKDLHNRNVSLTIKKNSIIAITGESGQENNVC